MAKADVGTRRAFDNLNCYTTAVVVFAHQNGAARCFTNTAAQQSNGTPCVERAPNHSSRLTGLTAVLFPVEWRCVVNRQGGARVIMRIWRWLQQLLQLVQAVNDHAFIQLVRRLSCATCTLT